MTTWFEDSLNSMISVLHASWYPTPPVIDTCPVEIYETIDLRSWLLADFNHFRGSYHSGEHYSLSSFLKVSKASCTSPSLPPFFTYMVPITACVPPFFSRQSLIEDGTFPAFGWIWNLLKTCPSCVTSPSKSQRMPKVSRSFGSFGKAVLPRFTETLVKFFAASAIIPSALLNTLFMAIACLGSDCFPVICRMSLENMT